MLGTCYLQSSVELLVVFSKLWLTRRDLLKVCFINYLFSSPGIIVRTGHWEKVKFSLYFGLGIVLLYTKEGNNGTFIQWFLKNVLLRGILRLCAGHLEIATYSLDLCFCLFCFCFCFCLFVCLFWGFCCCFTLRCFVLFSFCLFVPEMGKLYFCVSSSICWKRMQCVVIACNGSCFYLSSSL